MSTAADTVKRRISRQDCRALDISDAWRRGLLWQSGGCGRLKSVIGLDGDVTDFVLAESEIRGNEGFVTVYAPELQRIRVERRTVDSRACGLWFWECNGPLAAGGCGRLTAKLLRPTGCDEARWAPWQCARCLNVYFPRDRQRSTTLELLKRYDRGIAELQRLKAMILPP
jgi:hypothetical protein